MSAIRGKVGDSQLLASGSIVSPAGQPIEIRPFASHDDYFIRFEFKDYPGLSTSIERTAVLGGTVWQFINFNNALGTGTTEFIPLGSREESNLTVFIEMAVVVTALQGVRVIAWTIVERREGRT